MTPSDGVIGHRRPAPPPRLTVLTARDADVAVVLRRGPSSWARLHRWDTATDTVEDGGWLRARVSGRRIDLSPDGRLFVAFVAAHGRTPDVRRDTWVALSRPPWWRALALWFDGSTWSYGGFFADVDSCAGTGPGAPDEGTVPDWFDAEGPLPAPCPGRAWTDVTVPHNRRLRDGWVERRDRWWERPLAGGAVAVVDEHIDGAARVSTSAALRTRGGDLLPLGHDASLDVDRAGRALVGRGGRLEAHDGTGRIDVIADLNGQAPDPVQPPDWAGAWPGPPSRGSGRSS